MAGEVIDPNSTEEFEYMLFEGDPDNLKPVVYNSSKISPWIDQNALKLAHRIGRGPFGDVWLSTLHRSTKDYEQYHEVATKMMYPIKDDQIKGFLAKFDDVFAKCQGLENACYFHGVSVLNGRICVVMKFYEGSVGDKMARLKGGKLSISDVLRYGADIAHPTEIPAFFLFHSVSSQNQITGKNISKQIKARDVMAHKSIDFGLSDEILAIIPTDPYDQLDLARKITSMAIASRVSTLESEIMKLKQNGAEKDKRIADLQEQVKDLDRMFKDSERRLREATEENGKLMKERDMLALTAKKLGKDLSKLEAFKRQLMLSLSDDRSSLAESVNIPSGYRPIARTSSWGEETSTNNNGSDSMEIENQSLDASGSKGINNLSLTPYLTPRHTPTATPTAVSTVASPRGFSTAGSSPRLWSGSASPTKSRFEGLSSASSSGFTSSNTPTQQSSASSSPPSGILSGRVPRIDGKEFFRQARSRLTLEQFGAFLANIKELNAHKQSREETLKKAEEIFGTDNKDLYISFQRMLIRNLP